MTHKIDISIVIPAYKEEKRLPSTLDKLNNYIKKSNQTYEVIIVIEPSPDNTLEVVKSYSTKYNYITYIENDIRLGKGGTVQKGMLSATGKYIMFMDADGATDLSFINKAYEFLTLNPYEGVIASRAVKGSVLPQKQPVFRQVIGWIFRQITKSISKLPYNDTQCGCKMFKAEVVQDLFDDIIEKGFAFDVEILIKAMKKEIFIKELGCTWTDIEGSTVNPFKDGFKMLSAVVNLRKYYK